MRANSSRVDVSKPISNPNDATRYEEMSQNSIDKELLDLEDKISKLEASNKKQERSNKKYDDPVIMSPPLTIVPSEKSKFIDD